MFAEFLRGSVQNCRNNPLMHMGLSKVMVLQMNTEDTPSIDRLYLTGGLPYASVGYHYFGYAPHSEIDMTDTRCSASLSNISKIL